MGLLSFKENRFADAEQEFALAREIDPFSLNAAGYYLMLTRLSQGEIGAVLALQRELESTGPGERVALGSVTHSIARLLHKTKVGHRISSNGLGRQ